MLCTRLDVPTGTTGPALTGRTRSHSPCPRELCGQADEGHAVLRVSQAGCVKAGCKHVHACIAMLGPLTLHAVRVAPARSRLGGVVQAASITRSHALFS